MKKKKKPIFAICILLGIFIVDIGMGYASFKINGSVLFFLPQNSKTLDLDTVKRTFFGEEEEQLSVAEAPEPEILELPVQTPPAPVVQDVSTGETAEAVEEQEPTPTPVVGITEYVEYDPVPVDSKYYQDAGRIALTTKYPYEAVDDSYFADSVWIGDSRVLGIYDYSPWEEADFICDNGFCVYRWSIDKPVTLQRTGEKMLLADALSQKSYRKVYIMLGMNDCGYGTTETFRENYGKMLDMIKSCQPGAVIYLCANLHDTKSREESQNTVEVNLNINAKNVAISSFADGITTFYLDYNDLYTDENGYLLEDKTFDGVHLYAKYYDPWLQFFREHAVVR